MCIRKRILILLLLPIFPVAQSQTVAPINTELQQINDKTLQATDMIVSERGLSRFIALKLASYLSNGGDLSLFGNYAVLNSANDRLTVAHNFARTTSTGRVSSLATVGVQSNVAKLFSGLLDKDGLVNEVGVTLKYTLIGRGFVKFDNQRQDQKLMFAQDGEQKMEMNRRRAFALALIAAEMKKESEDFEDVLTQMKGTDLSSSDNLATVQGTLRDQFYKSLEKKYLKRFAELEADGLESADQYNLVSTYWISLSGYLPVSPTEYSLAPDYSTSFVEQRLYPWELGISYNRIYESRKWGRVFIGVGASVVQNSSIRTKANKAVDLLSYRNLGGTDTLTFAQLDNTKKYIGNYEAFVTPSIRGQLVWFPFESVGISSSMEIHSGKYDPLNITLGIPVRLKGSKTDSFVNFSLEARATDWNGTVQPEVKRSDKIVYGISIGLPFSSMIY